MKIFLRNSSLLFLALLFEMFKVLFEQSMFN